MSFITTAASPEDWDDQDLTALVNWDSLEPTAAELAAIETETDEVRAQERAFAELVSRLAPAAVRRSRPSRRRPGRRRPRPVGCAVRYVRTEATR